MIPVSASIVAFGAMDDLRSDPTGSREQHEQSCERWQMIDLSAAEACSHQTV